MKWNNTENMKQIALKKKLSTWTETRQKLEKKINQYTQINEYKPNILIKS